MVYTRLKRLLSFSAVVLLYNCSPTAIISHQLQPFFKNLEFSYESEQDPELVAASFPTNLKIIDALIQSNPNSTDLLLLGCSSYTSYTYGFVMEKADRLIQTDYNAGLTEYHRAEYLFKRAYDYGFQSLEKSHKDLDEMVRQKDFLSTNPFGKKEVPALYWTAASLGGVIASSQADPKWVIRLPEVTWLMNCALSLDPDWNEGSIYSAMISITLSRSDLGPEKDSLAQDYFQKALLASGGNDASIFVTMAEKVSVRIQDRQAFHQYLEKALDIDVAKTPENRLANVIAQKRANWLLSREDELFY